jgi:hypothetical protein
MMMDRKHFRFEKPHPPNEPGKSNLIIKNADLDEGLAPFVCKTVAVITDAWEDAEVVKSAAAQS